MPNIRNLIKNLGNSPVTEFTINILICCWVTVTVSLKLDGKWTVIPIIAGYVSGIVLIFLIIWTIYILTTKKVVNEMPVKSRRAIETCSWVFMIYCLLVNISPSLAWNGMIQIAWISFGVCIGYFINQKVIHE